MDFSVTRQLTSKIPERVSTEQIKAGLQRIKKAQEQVLSELKRNHPDYSIDVRTNSQVLNQKRQENYNLQKQLSVERQKSTEKSTLYRRRVVDLENSLAIHEQNQYKLKSENRALEEQLRMLKIRYSDLEKDYEKLVEESQISNRNLRNLEKEVMELAKKLQQEDVSKLRSQFTNLTAERNVIMSQKVTLLKTNSKLESENIELKSKLANMAVQISQKQWPSQAHLSSPSYKNEDFRTILNEIDKMNISHQHIFTALRNNTRLPRNIMDKENQYQNSLNKILEMLHFMQKGTSIADGAPGNYKFDHEQSFKIELQRMQNEYNKKYRRDIVRHQSEKDELQSKIKSRDKKIEDLQQQNQQIQMKISELRKQKSELLQEITDLSAQVSLTKQSQEKQEVKKLQEQQRKQKARDQEYRSIILQLNEQMQIIHKQKKDLDDLIGKMAQSRSQDQQKTRKRIGDLQQQCQSLKSQNQGLKSKYESTLIQKQHIQLSFQQCQTKNLTINKQIARQVLQKQRIISELNKLKQQNEINIAQVHKYRLQSDNSKKEAENVNNSYLLEIQRLIKEGLQLRQQIEVLLQDRHELRQLKGKYGLLMKDNQILGKKARYVNSQLDHLWMIKQVQYQNLNKIISDIKPL